MSIGILPTGAALGAEIRGVDLAEPIDDETFAAIERAYNDHGVIFFRDQHITPRGAIHAFETSIPLTKNVSLFRNGQTRHRRSVPRC